MIPIFIHKSWLVGTAATVLTAGIAGPATAADDHAHHVHAAAAYRLELLAPTNDGVGSAALGINDAGDVVGITRPTSSARPQQTVLWERHGDHFHAHELPNLESSTFSRGFDLAEDRTIVGEAFDANGSSVPVRWRDETPTRVTTLNEAGTGILRDIDEQSGRAVGTASGRAVTLSPAGEAGELPLPPLEDGVTVSSATAVAIDGDVVGGRIATVVPHDDHTHSRIRGALWTGGSATLLPTLDGASAEEVRGVNDDGTAVGVATVNSVDTAITWHDGAIEALPAPGLDGWPHTTASAVNDAGLIVGQATKFAGNSSFGGAAVAWDSHGAVNLATRVDGLPEGTELLSASDVNASGQVVGTAKTAEGQRGFVLSPVQSDPEPAAATLRAERVVGTYGRPATLVATVSSDDHVPTGTVTVTAGSSTVRTTIVGGVARLKLPAGVPASVRTARVDYSGDAETRAASTTVGVRLLAATTRTVVSTRAAAPRGARVKASIRVAVPGTRVKADGRVRVRVQGRTVRAVVRDGRAVVTLPRLRGRGATVVRVTYVGTSDLRPSTDSARIRVR